SIGGLWIYGGKSLLGGLVGAYVGVLVAKRFIGFKERTGDVFTPAVILGIAVGRIGCFFTEPPGTPTGNAFGVTLGSQTIARIPGCERCVPNVPLHPTFLYEIAFLLLLFGFLRWVAPKLTAVPGETFKLFLLCYGLFRFAVEFVRLNPHFALGLSGSQIFLLATLPLLLVYFGRQISRHAYHPTTSPVRQRVLVHGGR
ncbi:MAG: prolipoprotein diacylglyceryl transferase, partial [Actinomycetota bacterium]